jgi:hypothetical protein
MRVIVICNVDLFIIFERSNFIMIKCYGTAFSYDIYVLQKFQWNTWFKIGSCFQLHFKLTSLDRSENHACRFRWKT